MEKIFYPSEDDYDDLEDYIIEEKDLPDESEYNELDNYIVYGMILTSTHPNETLWIPLNYYGFLEPLWIPWVAPQTGTGVLTNPSLYTTTNINLDNIALRVGSVGSRQYIDRS
jgi:hypothetical protein